MQTLIFRTLTKSTSLLNDNGAVTEFSFDNVSTVAIREHGFYEIMVKKTSSSPAIPVARLPIATTNMIILEQ